MNTLFRFFPVRTTPLLNLLWILIFAAACHPQYEQETKIEKRHPDGEKKTETVYELRKGEKIPVEQIIYSEEGHIEIKGPLNEDKQRHGKWESYFPNEQLRSVGHFKNGTKHGESIVYFPNGQKRYSGSYKNGKRVGVWRFWDEDGELIDEKNF